MFYTIYVITNKLDGKWYFGMHQTKNLNDNYFGSGKYLKRAIEKYGIENFEKEILLLCESEEEMKIFEAGILCKDFLEEQQKIGITYNLLEGGKGGFGYIRKQEKYRDWCKKGIIEQEKIITREERFRRMLLGRERNKERINKSFSDGLKKWVIENGNPFKNKTHSEETKIKMSNSKKGQYIGNKNSQFGTFWITNGKENKKCKDIIPDGWYKGRI